MADRRRLAAIMLTDMVGYSRLAQSDEALALRLVREQEQVVRRAIRGHDGRTVKTLGDGCLAEFPNALDALECAVGVQATLSRRNLAQPNERIELRIGLHLGDVVHTGRDVFGDAVNIVARIQPLSDPGGVCVSQPVYDQVRNKLAVRFEGLGTPSLKNISTPIPLFRVLLPSARRAESDSSPTGRPCVAVLPMANLSGDGKDEYLADGITEELIQVLSKITGLRVIGRSSIMRFKQTTKSTSEIAGELGATSVVEASIRKAGNRVRVTARLLDGNTAVSLWSDEFDKRMENVFDLQSEISQKIAGALEVEILGGEQKQIRRPFTQSAAAHAAYLLGRSLLNQRTPESLHGALTAFRKAVRGDASLAAAHAGIADAYSTLGWLEFERPRAAFPKARAAAIRAVAADQTLAEAHASLGFVRFLYDRSWLEAEAEFRQCIALNPNYPTGHQFYSDLLKATGRFDEALFEVRRALELDPLSLAINTALGHVLYLARRYDESIRQYQRALNLDPNFSQAHLWFGRPYLEMGMYDRAIEEVQQAVRLTHESTMSLAVLAHAFASAGQSSPARDILAKLIQRGKSRYVPSYWIALIHVGLGDEPKAMSWLERADRERSAWLAWINVEPRFDRLRSSPRFLRLLRSLRIA